MSENDINYYVGKPLGECRPMQVYSDIVCGFLDDLSKCLRRDKNNQGLADVMTFAFWCRKANIQKLKNLYADSHTRLGKGLVFHIAPSNVPINFAYTLAFGLLAGNSNIVRVSQKNFSQVINVCNAINKVLDDDRYHYLRDMITVVSYPHDTSITEYFSQKCDVRVIWGGDATIKEVRVCELRPRSTELTFADRYSFALFDAKRMAEMTKEELLEIVNRFYNDTYLMDQNACSSPHMILWCNSREEVQNSFWELLKKVADNKYDFHEMKAMDKYILLCEQIIDSEVFESAKNYDNILKVVNLKDVSAEFENLRGKFGLFYQYNLKSEDELIKILKMVTSKTQTCVVCCVDKDKIKKYILDYGILGIDRIVDVGNAMDIGVYWDGYDVIGNLSRTIEY